MYYLNVEISSKLIRSPFREDKNPTCGFYYSNKGVLMLHDFATDEFFSAIDIVKKLFNKNYYQAIDKIIVDYGKIIAVENVESTINKLVKEEVEWFPGDPTWLSYFSKYKVITKELLLKYNVFAAKSVETLDYTLAKGSKTNPLFIYLVGDRIKWYKPLSKDKSKKWGGTTDANTFFGLMQLPKKGSILFITSSLKDVLVLRGLGFNAIAPNGEAYGISDFNTKANKEMKRVISSLEKRFNHILFYMNNDEAGLKANIALSKVYRKEFIANPPNKPKDISDYIDKYNYRRTYRMIKKLITKKLFRDEKFASLVLPY